MTPLYRGIGVAVLQCAMVLSLVGKYAIDRERLPRAWAEVTPLDPNLPVRGRFVSLRLMVELPQGVRNWDLPAYTDGVDPLWRRYGYGPVLLSAQNGRLVATPAPTGLMIDIAGSLGCFLEEPVAYFIPENVPDPSRRAPDEELWVEVSVPHKGPPRPLRLAVKKDGVLTPLELR